MTAPAWLIADDPQPELSNLDLLQLHGAARYRAVIEIRPAQVRPIAHRRATPPINWGRVLSWVAVVASIAVMAVIVAAVLLGSVGAL